MKETIQNVLAGTIVALIVYTIAGAFLGLLATINWRAEGKDGCVYRSLLSYMNPGFMAVCELARARFNVEQPVNYVPQEIKTLNN